MKFRLPKLCTPVLYNYFHAVINVLCGDVDNYVYSNKYDRRYVYNEHACVVLQLRHYDFLLGSQPEGPANILQNLERTAFAVRRF